MVTIAQVVMVANNFPLMFVSCISCSFAWSSS